MSFNTASKYKFCDCIAFDTSMKKIYSLCLLNMFCKLIKNGRSNVRLTAKGFVDNIQNTEM